MAPAGTDAESCACCARFDVTMHARRAPRHAAASDDESEGSPEDLECGMCE